MRDCGAYVGQRTALLALRVDTPASSNARGQIVSSVYRRVQRYVFHQFAMEDCQKEFRSKMKMRALKYYPGRQTWLMALLAGLLVAGCGQNPLLGSGGGGVIAPRVTAVAPVNGAVAVPISTTVAATFNESMAPITGAASLTVTCMTLCGNHKGSLALDH